MTEIVHTRPSAEGFAGASPALAGEDKIPLASRPVLRRYGVAVGSVALGWAAREAITPAVGATALPFVFFFPAVTLAAWYGGIGPGMVASLLSAGAANWFFIEPLRSGAIDRFGDGLALAAFFVGATFIVGAMESMHRANGRARAEVASRSASQRELQRTKTLLNTLLQRAPIGFAYFSRELRYVMINDWLARINGLPAEAHLGKQVGEVVPTLAAAVETVTQKIVATGEPVLNHEFSGETLMEAGQTRFWNESWYPVHDDEGVIIGFGAVVEEITQRQRAEEALRASEARLQSAMDLAGLSSYQWDPRTGVLEWDAALKAMWGLAPDAHVDYALWLSCVHPEDKERAEEAVKQCLDPQGDGRFRAEYRVLAKDGVERWVSVQGRMTFVDGKPTDFVGTALEVTERRRAEEALRTALRAKDDFLAMLSHELRTPLTPVLMLASDLEADELLSPQVRADMATIRRHIELETRLIDDLLDATSISRGKLQMELVVIDVHALLSQTREIMGGEAREKGLDLQFVLSASEHSVLADAARLQQVFCNLVKNALKFTPSGGCVIVATANPAPGRISIKVHDTGIGISAKALPHIFGAFEQGDLGGPHRFGGLGLGLAISKAIVERLHGALRAESEGSGRGAVFTVELGAVARPSCEPIPPALSPPTPRPALRLLVVEDHAPTRSILERILVRDGHRVFATGSVQGALTLASVQECDAMITDVGLPDGTGVELFRAIQQRYGWPGIALSGYGTKEDIHLAEQAGFAAHLTKPVHPELIREAVGKLLELRNAR